MLITRVRTSDEVYTHWVRSGHCPGDGPITFTATPDLLRHLTTTKTFLSAHKSRTKVPDPDPTTCVSSQAQTLPPIAPDATTAPATTPVAPQAASAVAVRVPPASAAGASAPRMQQQVYARGARIPSTTCAAGEASSVPSSALPPLAKQHKVPSSSSQDADAVGQRTDPEVVGAGIPPVHASAASAAAQPASRKRRLASAGSVGRPVQEDARRDHELWVDGSHRCGQCHKIVTGSDPALLCDAKDCEGWLICAECIADTGLSIASGHLAPLRCPKHQLIQFIQQQDLTAGLERALLHKPGSVGRFLGCITAFTQGAQMSAVLAVAPVAVPDEEVPAELMEEAHKAGDAGWDQPRRDRLRNVAFKLLWLADKFNALDIRAFHLRLLAEAYCRHRLSDDRPPGWMKCGAKHVKSELSAMSQAAADLNISIPPYLGAKRCLESRGAFMPREHSPRFPLLPYAIFEMLDQLPRPLTPARQKAADALEWNAFWGLRPLYVEAVTKRMYTPHNGGYLLKWQKATKTKRGDRLAGPDAVLSIPQVSAARHQRLTRIYESMPDGDDPPFKGYRQQATAMINDWFVVPEGFVLSLAAQRNGVDMAMLALGVPHDHTDAHLWWARAAMRGYYAGLHTGVTMLATSLFDKVIVKPIAPGWYDKVSMPPTVDWSDIKPMDQSFMDGIKPSVFQEEPEAPEEAIGAPPTEAPKGVSVRKARIRPAAS